MYKLISAALFLILILSLSACAGTGAEAEISLTGEIGGEITVSAYDTMMCRAFLEDAARLFEEKYPGTKVNVETFSAMPDIKTSGDDGENMMLVEYKDDPQGRQDYINKINTTLMSGGGADILAMDVLPFYKYADSGQLENLAAYMQADPEFNKADYRANILDAAVYKNGSWFLPMDYTFTYYAYNSALLTGSAVSGFGTGEKFTAEELIALAEPYFTGSEKLSNRPDYAQGPRPDMWGLLLAENYTSFVDVESGKAHFTDGGFAALLESVKRYGEQGYIPQGATERADAAGMMLEAGEGADERSFFKPQDAINLISLFTRNLGLQMTAMAEGGTMAIGEDDEIAGIAAAANGSVPFTYGQAYGINANSKNKEAAWAFLRFLLCEEMQLNTNLSPTALPISNSAREKKIQFQLTGMMGQSGQSLNAAHVEAISKFNEAVEQLSGQIDAYIIRDTVIDDMISAEAQYFFDGVKTAEEVAAALQNKVELYLNE